MRADGANECDLCGKLYKRKEDGRDDLVEKMIEEEENEIYPCIYFVIKKKGRSKQRGTGLCLHCRKKAMKMYHDMIVLMDKAEKVFSDIEGKTQ